MPLPGAITLLRLATCATLGLATLLSAGAQEPEGGTPTTATAQEQDAATEPSAQEPKLGDVSDGNRSVPVHVIELLDEDGLRIDPRAENPLPFSPRQTCQPCHDYETISRGWHFNAADPEAGAGRRGEPWVLVDRISATQVPLSYRDWPGTERPEAFGLSPFLFTERFGRHLNGGTASEVDALEPVEVYWRWLVSGRPEINCLSCHDLDAGHDQSEYDRQIGRASCRERV